MEDVKINMKQARVLANRLNQMGLVSGIGLVGSSSYPVINVAGGYEVWAYDDNSTCYLVEDCPSEVLTRLNMIEQFC